MYFSRKNIQSLKFKRSVNPYKISSSFHKEKKSNKKVIAT